MSPAESMAAPAAPAALRPASERLLAVASGKGGVGKTVLAIGLAHALSVRLPRVLLFDADLGLANVDVQLGLEPARDLAAVLAGEVPLEAAVTRFGGAGARGFDILAGRSGSPALGRLAPGEISGLARSLLGLAPGYDRVILDIGAGIDQVATTFCGIAGRVLVVLTDEPTALTDAYALIKVLSLKGRPPAFGIVVNMAADLAEGRRAHEALARACRHFLGLDPPLLGIIRRDPKVKAAIKAQQPLLTRYPQTQAALDLEALARSL